MYVYIRSEPGLYTVGFYRPDGKWEAESDHAAREEAAARVAYLNGQASPRTEYTEGQLYRQPGGRWLLAPQGNHELTSGDPVELWAADKWQPTRIEHSASLGGYYAVNGIPLRDGMHARIRRAGR
jgi:hypothetical protein